MGEVIRAADLFCGAGGTSTGLSRACKRLGVNLDLIAVNHWDIALQTHRANHPDARHIWASLDSLNPREVTKGKPLDLLIASPECIYHSVARGGKPIREQDRASAWCVLRWVEALQPRAVLIENVGEFTNWGPLDEQGHRIKDRAGETYGAYLNALRSLGYNVEDRILNAADYGDPTSRRRLFVMAYRGNRPITWPAATHSEHGNGIPRWRGAKEIIDWNIRGESIFGRKKPLAEATLKRIEAGLRKFGVYGSNKTRSIHRPLPTVTAGGNHIGLCEPFLVQYHNSHNGKSDGDGRVYSADRPIPTLDTSNRYGLVEPFILPHPHGKNLQEVLQNTPARSMDLPLPSITASSSNYIGLVEPFITILKGKSTVRGVKEPLPTVTTQQHLYLCEPFLVKYYGQSKSQSVRHPLDTVTTVDRFGLVEPVALDILFRMLQPHELAAAMSFDGKYKFMGPKRDIVRQIGNAVPVRMATSLCETELEALLAA